MDPMQTSEISKDERTFGMLCHLLALAGLIIPFGSIIGPLVMWLVKREGMPFVDDQGKESLNFQITVAIAGIVCFILSFIGIGILLLVALGVFWFIMIILATIKANEGQRYRYPFAIRFLS